MPVSVKGVTVVFAKLSADAAGNAFSFIKEKLILHSVRFGIVTPHARQGTSLEKHGGADARPVGGAETLDVEYFSVHFIYHAPCAE